MPQASLRRLVYANAAIALGTLLLLAAIWWIANERTALEYEQSLAEVRSSNTNLSLLLESRARSGLRDVDQALQFLRREYVKEGRAPDAMSDLREVGLDTEVIESVVILGPDGQPLVSSDARFSHQPRPYLERMVHASGDDIFIGLPVAAKSGGGYTMDVARRIARPDGSFGGAVVAAVSPVALANFYGQASLGPRDLIVLGGTDGVVRLRVSGGQVSYGQDMRDSPALHQLTESLSTTGSFVARSRTDGVERYLTYRALADYPLVVIVGTDEEGAFAGFERHRRTYYTLAMVGTVMLLLLSAALMRELSRRRETMLQLVRDEARFRATFDQAFVGMAQSTRDGTLIQVNPTLCRIVGRPEHELVGRPLLELLHPDERAKPDALGASARVQRRLAHADGRLVWADIATTVVRDNEGREDCRVTVVQDISEFKRIDRMKSEFVSMVSHELRTPLTSIRGSLGLIAGGVVGALPEAAKNLVDIAKSNCERLIRLINDILDTEKIESGKMVFDLHEVDLAALARGAIDANQGFAGQHKARLVLHATTPAPRVRADADRLTQVLTNLISNATKFSPQGADVEVVVSSRPGRARVEVRDRGPGIPPEFHDRIFRKFSQADSSDARQKGGTGLGLNISKAIVERLGGEIGFESVVGEGTTFWFELPEIPKARVEPVTHGTGPRILVCEDDPDIARLIGMMLGKAGYDSQLAHTAADAREAAMAGGYAAITVDLRLPDEPGISLMRALRRDPVTHDLPVIVISAEAERGRLQLNGENLPVADWLGKPIDENRLVRAVRRAVGETSEDVPRILHVEDDPDVQRIAAAIARDFATFEFAGSVSEARALLRDWRFNLVLLDLELPDGSGWDLLPDIERLVPRPPVVVFSVHEVEAAWRRRVAAVLLKSDTSNEELLATLQRLLPMREEQTPG